MHRSWLDIGVAVGLLSACSGERVAAPSGADGPATPDLTGQAFHLVIDTRTGQVEVGPPSRWP